MQRHILKILKISCAVIGMVFICVSVHADEDFDFAPDLDQIFVESQLETTSFPAIKFGLKEDVEEEMLPVLDAPVEEPTTVLQEEPKEEISSLAETAIDQVMTDYEESLRMQEMAEEEPVREEVQDMDVALRDAVHHQWDKNIQKLIAQARVATTMLDLKAAEEYYIEALNRQMDDELRIAILFEMADYYHTQKIYSKESAILEKYLDLYPRHAKASEVVMRLGYLYREIGAYEVAIERFFQVLHMSLSVSSSEFESFKGRVLQAQLEIAHTHFMVDDYVNAIAHYNRLNLMKLSEEEKKLVLFRSGYAYFELKHYKGVLEKLQLFLQKFSHSDLAPEAHYILANAYTVLDRSEDAVREVRNLLNEDIKEHPKSQDIWRFWQKKTANKIANQFYEQGDYMNALKIYQAMVPVSRSAEWQWPIIYQIGLCFEQLGMYPKAHQAYTVIMNSTEWEIDLGRLSEALSSIKEMAEWRQDHLKWIINSEFQLRKLIRPTTADIIAL